MVKFENKGKVKIGDVEMEYTYGLFEGYKVIKDETSENIVATRMFINPDEAVIIVGPIFDEIPERLRDVILHREVNHIVKKHNYDVFKFGGTKADIEKSLLGYFNERIASSDVDPVEFEADEYAVSKVGRNNVIDFLRGLRRFFEISNDELNKDQNITIPKRNEMLEINRNAIQQINKRMAKITGTTYSAYGYPIGDISKIARDYFGDMKARRASM